MSGKENNEDGPEVQLKSDLVDARKTIADKFKQSYDERIKQDVDRDVDGECDEIVDGDCENFGNYVNLFNSDVNNNEYTHKSDIIDERKISRLPRKRKQSVQIHSAKIVPNVSTHAQPKLIKRNLLEKENAWSSSSSSSSFSSPSSFNSSSLNPNELCNCLRKLTSSSSSSSRRAENTNDHDRKQEIDSILKELCKRNILL